jgi:hypothetical protein
VLHFKKLAAAITHWYSRRHGCRPPRFCAVAGRVRQCVRRQLWPNQHAHRLASLPSPPILNPPSPSQAFCTLTSIFRSLTFDSNLNQHALEWKGNDYRPFVFPDRTLPLPELHGNAPRVDACVVDMNDGGMFFAATRPRSRDSINYDAEDAIGQVQDEENDRTQYEIVMLQLPSSPSQPQPMPFVAPGLNNEPISRHLLPHPSLPLLFAFTPSKILVLRPGIDASSTSVHLTHAFLPAAALPSPSRLWGLTSSLKTLFAGSG